ncbi:peptidase [Endozoicomonas montiporae]|uniref:Peptidase n=2 Tax=Endozoicomonas montiporae TaxID=1027273 RepID=A0A081N8Z0_9GAMM|nr:SapC family protein [Endozoicomonas montiporae]AMO55162.1 SapC protein [Endozoicomonas montiporae CL-33]KEQ14913.1 peptidase [Endozoicomonas montiporae]
MPELLFYKEPAPLNREAHKALKYKSSTDYRFTEDVNSVPLTGIEFFEASRDMPVLFSKDNEGHYFPLALLSLMEAGHKQLDDGGRWENSYVPAFVRRYPFAMTDEGTVCFDKAAGQVGKEEGDALFDEDGENSETLSNIISFLNNYDQQYKNTRAYCDECDELELFTPFNLQVLVDKDKPLRLEGLYAIDEKKLAELPEDKINHWFKSGWLAWSYAHQHSLGALKRLLKKQQ